MCRQIYTIQELTYVPLLQTYVHTRYNDCACIFASHVGCSRHVSLSAFDVFIGCESRDVTLLTANASGWAESTWKKKKKTSVKMSEPRKSPPALTGQLKVRANPRGNCSSRTNWTPCHLCFEFEEFIVTSDSSSAGL